MQEPFQVDLAPLEPLSDEQLVALIARNPSLRIELTADQKLIIMPPTHADTGLQNASISGQLYGWNQRTGLGYVFDSSTGFRLPNGAMRSPDAAWIARARWQALSPEQKQSFAPVVPDFVIELRSDTDWLPSLEAKMNEWIAVGVQLAWLIDPQHQRTSIYRPGRGVEHVDGFDLVLRGEPLLPGFELNLTELTAL